MAILMLVALGAEAVYAITLELNDTVTSVNKELDQEQNDQQKPSFNVLKEQSNAIPQSTETIHWCNVFVKTLPQVENFRLLLKPVANAHPTKSLVVNTLTATANCIYSYYAAPNAP